VNHRRLLGTGIVGTVVTAVCFHVVALGAVGLSVWLGWLDMALFPLLVVFIGLSAYGLYRVRRGPRS